MCAERWEDQACVIGTRPLNEKDVIVELLTAQHGRIVSVARFGLTSKHRGLYHAGNVVKVAWQARLPTHMGHIMAEVERSILPCIVNHPLKLLLMQCAHALCHQFLYEHTVELQVFLALHSLYETFLQSGHLASLQSYALFEYTLLNSSGYGLDLKRCAVTYSTENLTYISPKTGRAVSFDAGKPYHDKLFPLPRCYAEADAPMTEAETMAALNITLYFIEQRLCTDIVHRLPEIRYRLESKLQRFSKEHNRPA